MSNYVAISVSADGLALLGARPSAGTVMTDFESRRYTGLALKGQKLIITFSQIYYIYDTLCKTKRTNLLEVCMLEKAQSGSTVKNNSFHCVLQ